jgi:hypothetical protein
VHLFPLSSRAQRGICTTALLLSTALGCHRDPGLEISNAKAAAATGVNYGDCVEARKRAAAKPDLDVDRLPAPIAQKPAPFARMPASVRNEIARKGAVVKLDVMVDTLGRADMKTFTVVQSTHPWLTSSMKSTLPRWKFTPAELAGCKVPRVYKFSATSKPRV